jgi:hypothetical protein
MKALALALLLLAAPALADNPPLSAFVYGPNAEVKGGTLCSAQTATSTGCTGTVNGVSDQLVADLRGYSSVAFYGNQSTATGYTCDVYTSDNGYDADSGVGQDRSTTALSVTQEAIVLDGALAFAWIECSAIADNSVIITFVATK